MANKIKRDDGWYECPTCGYIWEDAFDLSFDEGERVACCPDCGELIEDSDDED